MILWLYRIPVIWVPFVHHYPVIDPWFPLLISPLLPGEEPPCRGAAAGTWRAGGGGGVWGAGESVFAMGNWEMLGKNAREMGGKWENDRKMMEMIERLWENDGKLMETYGKTRENDGQRQERWMETLENNGNMMERYGECHMHGRWSLNFRVEILKSKSIYIFEIYLFYR